MIGQAFCTDKMRMTEMYRKEADFVKEKYEARETRGAGKGEYVLINGEYGKVIAEDLNDVIIEILDSGGKIVRAHFKKPIRLDHKEDY